MPNMSYCRFQNTLSDLQDCLDWLNGDTEDDDSELSPSESKAKERLINLCCEIALDFGESVGREITEE